MAISRAVARLAVTRWVTRLTRFSLRLGNGVLHGLLVQQPVLDEALRKTAQGHATGAANCRYCVIIH
jgi:hypothetical protein